MELSFCHIYSLEFRLQLNITEKIEYNLLYILMRFSFIKEIGIKCHQHKHDGYRMPKFKIHLMAVSRANLENHLHQDTARRLCCRLQQPSERSAALSWKQSSLQNGAKCLELKGFEWRSLFSMLQDADEHASRKIEES